MEMEDKEMEKILTHFGATVSQIQQFIHYGNCGNKKGQELILCRCMGIQRERLQEKRKQLACLDYMIAKLNN